MDSTYAPQSPDLSSFLSGGPSPSKPQPQSSVPTSSYAPRSPNLQSFAQFESPNSHAVGGQPRNLGAFGNSYQLPPRNLAFQGYEESFQGQNQAYPSIPNLPPAHDFNNVQIYSSPGQYPPQNYPQTEFKSEPVYGNTFDTYPTVTSPTQGYGQGLQDMSMSGRGKKSGAEVKAENGYEEKKGLGPSMGIDVKTKFPVARIKRIMQADEEVGKVAQVTPVAVSKALELFMISLVTKSADLAKAGNSKRVTAQHLKKAIEADEQFDFLNDIISKVVEGPEAGGKRVKEDDDSSEAESKPKKARGRKKKTDA